jgi:trehalose utilization protein
MGKGMLWAMAAVAVSGLLLGAKSGVAAEKRVVVVWSEGTAPKNVYPNDINGMIAEGLTKDLPDWEVVKAGLNDPEQGLSDDLLKRCDVLIWWGHQKHGLVKDALVDKIFKRVTEEGMGFIGLHSAHFSKINIKLMSVMPTKKEILDKVQPKGRVAAWGAYIADSKDCFITIKDPQHPIAAGLKDFSLEDEERYSDPYACPEPKSVVFGGYHTLKKDPTKKDEAVMGMTWDIGKAKMFYCQLGHESKPIFMNENIRKMMANAVKWAAPEKK